MVPLQSALRVTPGIFLICKSTDSTVAINLKREQEEEEEKVEEEREGGRGGGRGGIRRRKRRSKRWRLTKSIGPGPENL